jgi:hypothetical protein
MRCAVGATLALAAVLAGCGKPAPAPSAGSSSGNDQARSAAEVAQAARADLRCPAKIVTPPRAEGAPVDDVLGVRPGQGYDEAWAAVLCTSDLLIASAETGRGFDIEDYGQKLRQGFSARFAEPHVVRTGKEIVMQMQRDASARGSNSVREGMQPGQAAWFVGTMGLPGQERVLSVSREERFEADHPPTVAALHDALIKKYGRPTRDAPAGNGQLPTLRWATDTNGVPVVEGSPIFSECVGRANPSNGVSVNPVCGVVVEALLIPQTSNPELVDRLQVGVVNQALGYELLSATERQLAQADRQRRQQEVDQAAKSTKTPAL